MILLGPGEASYGNNFRVHRFVDFLFQRRFAFQRLPALVGIVIENGIAILPPPSPAGGGVAFPEEGAQLRIGDAFRVIVYLHGFGVIADVAVIGVLRRSAGIAHTGADNAFDKPEPGFDAPESAQAEGGGFEFLGSRPVNGRYGRLGGRFRGFQEHGALLW